MKKESDEFDYKNYPTNLYSNSFSPKDAITSLFKKVPSDATTYKVPNSGPVDYSEKTELVALPSNETPVSWQVAKMLNNYDDLHKKAGLNEISGDEYLVYNDHELFDPKSIKQFLK